MAGATVDSYAATRLGPASVAYRGVVAEVVVGTAADQNAGHAIVRRGDARHRDALTVH